MSTITVVKVRRPHPAYKQRYQPKHRKDGTFKKSKLGKYNARGFYLDSKWFPSQAEGDRYLQLKVLLELGRIDRLETQVAYTIQVDGVPICSYKADFRYWIRENGSITHQVVEDVKGMVTKEYAIKKKLTEAKYRLKIHELPAAWLKHYEKKTGPECLPVIAQLEAERKARAKARKLAALEKGRQAAEA